MNDIYEVINYLAENLEVFKPIKQAFEEKDNEIKELKANQQIIKKAIDDLTIGGEE